jgi:hypothetical protein
MARVTHISVRGNAGLLDARAIASIAAALARRETVVIEPGAVTVRDDTEKTRKDRAPCPPT